MKRTALLPVLCSLLILTNSLRPDDLQDVRAAPFSSLTMLVLYDANSGTIPGAPLLSFTAFPPGAAQPIYSDGATILDTTAPGNDTYAGWLASAAATPGFPILDRTDGFQVNFIVQVEAESHRSEHRAGFSVIVLASDARGIELAFWENEIWAQADDATGGLFRRAEGAAFATTAGLTEYQVTIAGDSYTLTASASPILSGPVRDYRAFDAFPDPYETPNFLFLGDDTTSAQARVRLSFLSITGTEAITPTFPSTITGTGSPVSTMSFTPLPSTTPVPSPVPAGRGFGLCPSSWIFLPLILTPAAIRGKLRARSSMGGIARR